MKRGKKSGGRTTQNAMKLETSSSTFMLVPRRDSATVRTTQDTLCVAKASRGEAQPSSSSSATWLDNLISAWRGEREWKRVRVKAGVGSLVPDSNPSTTTRLTITITVRKIRMKMRWWWWEWSRDDDDHDDDNDDDDYEDRGDDDGDGGDGVIRMVMMMMRVMMTDTMLVTSVMICWSRLTQLTY